MYNLLISLGAGLVAFGVGALAGRWYYGFVPAVLVAPLVYYVLMMRTGKQVEAIMKQAVGLLQAGKIEPAIEVMEQARPLGKWQFLVEQQIDGQIGSLYYMQRKAKLARPFLEKAWKRNWQAQAMLAILDAKEGKNSVERLDKAKILARKEVLFWAVSAWLHLNAAKDADGAMKAVNEGVEAAEGNPALKQLQGAIQNDKLRRFDWGRTFGQSWYQFFPEQYPALQQQQRAGFGGQPQPGVPRKGKRRRGRPR